MAGPGAGACRGFPRYRGRRRRLHAREPVRVRGEPARFLATLSVGGRSLDDRLEFEARRLEKTFQLALEEAEIKGLLIGFRYTPDRYEFVGLNAEGKWAAYAESGPFRARALTRPFEILLNVEGRSVPPAQEPKDEESEPEPQILLLPSGEATSFVMVLRAAGLQDFYTLEADALGKLTLTRGDPQESR